MKKILLDTIPNDLPREIEKLVLDSKVYDSSCNSGARVLFVDKKEGYFLKIASKGALEREKIMTEYFHAKGIGAQVLHYSTSDNDYLLTTRVKGEDCTFERYFLEPKKLSKVLGEELRKLHELDFSDCPVVNKMDEYFDLAEKNFKLDNYDKSHFPDSYGYKNGQEAYSVFKAGKDALNSKVLLHGDYCLPNVILKDWRLSGFIDVGGGGIGDRHVDLFWGIWSLGFNLKSDDYRNVFLDAYGRDKVDEEKLRIVGAIEVFG